MNWGFVSSRFRTDNPGPWILHCHIERHFWKYVIYFLYVAHKLRPPPLNPLDLWICRGLAIVFAEDTAGEVNGTDAIRPVDGWDELCRIWDSLPNPDI